MTCAQFRKKYDTLVSIRHSGPLPLDFQSHKTICTRCRIWHDNMMFIDHELQQLACYMLHRN